MCVKASHESLFDGGGERAEKRKVKRVLTTRTDVLTTSETLCLSSAAVPGFPNPRVNLRVSWCAAVAIVAHLLASMSPQIHDCQQSLEENHRRFTCVSDPQYALQGWVVLRRRCLFVRTFLSHTFLITTKSPRVTKMQRAASFHAINCHNGVSAESFIGRPARDRRLVIWLRSRRTPPNTGLEAGPLLHECESGVRTLDYRLWFELTESIHSYCHNNRKKVCKSWWSLCYLEKTFWQMWDNYRKALERVITFIWCYICDTIRQWYSAENLFNGQ